MAASFSAPDLMEWLERIPALINGPDAVVLSEGRNRNIKLDTTCNGQNISVVVKAFGRPSLVKNAIDRNFRGSKAMRTWMAAVHLSESGVGTPAPIAFLERWAERRLVESYVVTLYQEGISCFTTELNNLFRHDPECEKFMTLMQAVADGIRAMHECGYIHNDLGNQNVMLRRSQDGREWNDVQFIDLNRGYIRESLSDRERARDISRIYLPSDLLRVFKEMYYARQPPDEFQKWERRYRRRYARHANTRRWRHPFRELKKRNNPGELPEYPDEKDIWIWDERSGQAQTVMTSKDRARYYPRSRLWDIVRSSISALIPVWREYRRIMSDAYSKPVVMKNGIGITVEVLEGRLERQLELLAGLGPVPLMIRFYHHRSDADCCNAVAAVRQLHKAGHPISIALVQDRLAVRNPGAWQVWVGELLSELGDIVELVEIGHAINRVKWGIWGFDEYRQLVDGVSVFCSQYPKITFSGPAVIDFEYPYTVAALAYLPEGFSFGALSHHLYVDRRGAPENRQGRYAALEKFAWGRAIARQSKRCEDRFIVSEVNWPIERTGVYSPVGSPYVSPGPRYNDPSVSEDDYADYMVRYLLIALCSGIVERVFWWRLAAYGYGLVDDSNEEQWRERPAYKMLKQFLAWVGDATFVKRMELDDAGTVAFEFSGDAVGLCSRGEEPLINTDKHGLVQSDAKAGRFWIAYTSGNECEIDFHVEVTHAVDAMGEVVEITDKNRIKLSGRVVCLW